LEYFVEQGLLHLGMRIASEQECSKFVRVAIEQWQQVIIQVQEWRWTHLSLIFAGFAATFKRLS
jgi:hypothetical protein